MIHLILFSYLTGVCLSFEVRQSPTEVIVSPSQKVVITCRHKTPSYDRMFWYQQSYGETEIKPIGYLYNKDPTMESGYEDQFEISGDLSEASVEKYSLLQFDAKPERQAFYLCAASSGCTGQEVYFGAGTKLTVIEGTPREPKVEIFAPAEKECQSSVDGTTWRKTLVCVASQFNPNNVDVTWSIDGTKATRNVATDSLAQQDKESKLYKITSRLMVEGHTWRRPGIKYTCTVTFNNGTKISPHTKTLENHSPNKVPYTVGFLRLSHEAKLSYISLIIKSSVYGAFVVLLLWKIKVSGSER